jgi:hypothetical protein
VNLFWADLNDEMEDPVFRAEFVRVSRVIAATDARRNRWARRASRAARLLPTRRLRRRQ